MRTNNKTSKWIKFFGIIVITAIITTSCEKEDAIEVKDYGLKVFTADYNYDSKAGHGDVAYKNQTFFNLKTGEAVAVATYGTDDWTDFYLIADSAQANFTSEVTGWDIVFTNYTAMVTQGGTTMPYGVTGVLTNQTKNIEIALYKYTAHENTDSISQVFVNLKLSDVMNLTYSSEIDVIGYNWKTINMTTYTYDVNSNDFYILKLDNETYYKLRFTSFYGESTDVRAATIQYQLIQ